MPVRASLLVSAHNEGHCLRNTIQSVLAATAGLDVELIIADDASTDGSVADVAREFPRVKVVRNAIREGASPTKHLAATHAVGEVLVFLDGHTHPERDALRRLIEDVEATDGNAIITPAVPHLDTRTWTNSRSQVGHGYGLTLHDLGCRWVARSLLREQQVGGRTFLESPALIGCVVAVSRRLYHALRGFDPHMRSWGVEDLDFGLKAWLLGHPVLHDPHAVVGHRFRQSFDNFTVPLEHLWANQLRMARRHFTEAVWSQWVLAFRKRHEKCGCQERAGAANSPLTLTPPQGPWALAWETFQQDRASVEQERSDLLSRRVHDEFWYAERFGLEWPRLERERKKPCGCLEAAGTVHAQAEPSPQPSPSPSPAPCEVLSVTPENLTICAGVNQAFTATVKNPGSVSWSGGGQPATGTGTKFTTKWNEPGNYSVSATCGDSTKWVSVTVASVEFGASSLRTGYTNPTASSTISTSGFVMCTPPHLAGEVDLRSSNSSRFTITITERIPETGYISFFVKGKSATPASKPEGDAYVNALLGGKICSRLPVIVVVPKKLRTPYPEADSAVTPYNMLADRTTSPAYFGTINANQVARVTVWEQRLTIGVNDQFNQPLDAMYEGAEVKEQVNGNWRSINQSLSASGTYEDPVGWIMSANPVLVPRNSDEAAAWPTEPTLTIPAAQNFIQNIPVTVWEVC